MMRRAALALACAGILLVAGSFPVPALQVAAARSGQVVFATPVKEGDRFSYRFIHSVERSPVEEFFEVNGSYRLWLYATTFRSMNTGSPQPTAEGERLERTTEGFRLSNMRRVFPAIDMWVHEDYQNTLTMGPRRIWLPALAGNTLLRVSIGRVSVVRLLYWRWVTSRRLSSAPRGVDTRGKDDHERRG
jgi:hypothetical protein